MQETPQQYIARMLGYVEGKDPLRIQRTTPQKLAKAIKGLDRKRLRRRPAPGKWSINEILAHLADTELVGGTIAHIVRMFAGHDLNHLGQVEKMVKDSRARK